MKKRADGFRRFFLQLCECGPTAEKCRGNGRRQVIEPVQNLRKIQLELIGDAVGVRGSEIHQLPAFFHQQLEPARGLIIWLRPAQPVSVERQQVQQNVGVLWIALASRRMDGLSIGRAGGGVNGIKHQMVVA